VFSVLLVATESHSLMKTSVNHPQSSLLIKICQKHRTAVLKMQYADIKMRSVNNNIIIIPMTMFMVLSSWLSHCESSPG